MNGSSQQQQHQSSTSSDLQYQQYQRYARLQDEQPLQLPSTSSGPQIPMQLQALQSGGLIQTSTPSAASSSSSPNKAIMFGKNMLQPVGTLIVSQRERDSWAAGKPVIVSRSNTVMQANLFPIPSPSTTGSWHNGAPQPSSSTSYVPNQVPVATTSSATPDSGIQSVPTSPPSPSYQQMLSVHEEEEEEEEEEEGEEGIEEHEDGDDGEPDFTDMPLLKPADEDDCYEIPSTSAGPALTNVDTPTTPSPVPPVPPSVPVISRELLIQLSSSTKEEIDKILEKFDPETANAISKLINMGSDKNEEKKHVIGESEVSSTTPTTERLVRGTRKRTKCTRNTRSPDVTTSTNIAEEVGTSPVEEVKVEGKKRGRKPKRRRVMLKEEPKVMHAERVKRDPSPKQEPPATPEPTSSRPQSSLAPTPTPTDPVHFRLRVHEMVERQLEEMTRLMSTDMMELRLSHTMTHKAIPTGKRKESFFRSLSEQSKKLKKGHYGKRMKLFMTEEEQKKERDEPFQKPVKEETSEDVPKIRSRLPSRRTRVDDSPEVAFDVEGKFNGEYFEIPKSVPSSDAVLPYWRAPSLTCGCTKGACTSDMDCLNRALRVQCNSECTVPYCSNRRFWREDNNKLSVSTRKILKTKAARRAGEFLCEYAGEVVTSEEAQRRFKKMSPDAARIIAIGSELFVDATTRSNLARFVKHSCKPNSRLEIWSVNGLYRAGVFALIDLAPNTEITVDKSTLLPSDVPCYCGASECKKVIRGVKKPLREKGEEVIEPSRLFLKRNIRKVIERSHQSGLPAILTTEEALLSRRVQMKKVLAAFAFRVRRIDGSMDRSMLPYYSAVVKFLKTTGSNPNPAQFVSLFRKWLNAIDDDDLERAFIAFESRYLSSCLLASAQSKKQKEHAPRARAPSTSCHSPILSKRGDADLSYLESLHPIGSYDPDDAWESYRANANDNAVRCVCGSLDEDGEMVQCDGCQFWLHMDCCDYQEDSKDEYECEFCLGKVARPSKDIKLTAPLDVRFEHCDYYRSLINRRGIQVRLNETVYVNRIPPDDHKGMLRHLREEKGARSQTKPNKSLFPDAPTEPIPLQRIERKEARIFRVERLFVCPGNNRFVFGSFYAWPHETYADTGRVFSRKEVFATPYYETLPLDEVIGRCLVIDVATWSKGRPKVPKFKEDDVFLCEMQIGKNQRVFEKVPPKNRWPINTQPYVFTKFSQPKKVVRDFRPYDPSNPSPKPTKHLTAHVIPTTSPTTLSSDSQPLPEVDTKKMAQKSINRILRRLSKKD